MTTSTQNPDEPPRNRGGHYSTPQELASRYEATLARSTEVERLMADYRDALASAREMPCEESRRWVQEARDALGNTRAVQRTRSDRWVNNPSPGRW